MQDGRFELTLGIKQQGSAHTYVIAMHAAGHNAPAGALFIHLDAYGLQCAGGFRPQAAVLLLPGYTNT
jgi:hypothetical protein